jgi:hypothetical protein
MNYCINRLNIIIAAAVLKLLQQLQNFCPIISEKNLSNHFSSFGCEIGRDCTASPHTRVTTNCDERAFFKKSLLHFLHPHNGLNLAPFFSKIMNPFV